MAPLLPSSLVQFLSPAARMTFNSALQPESRSRVLPGLTLPLEPAIDAQRPDKIGLQSTRFDRHKAVREDREGARHKPTAA